MIENILKLYCGRFEIHLPTTYHSTTLMPSFTIKDNYDGEVFTIKIESLAADPEIVLENVLNEKIINKREQKINSIIDGTAFKKIRSGKSDDI